MINAIIFEPQKAPYYKKIEESSFTCIVKGPVRCIDIGDELCLITCADSGIRPFNRPLRDENGNAYSLIAGTFIAVGKTDDEYRSLFEEEAIRAMCLFGTPCTFEKADGCLNVIERPDLLARRPRYVLTGCDCCEMDSTVYDTVEEARAAMRKAYDVTLQGFGNFVDDAGIGCWDAFIVSLNRNCEWLITEVK